MYHKMDINYPTKTDLPEKGKMYDNYKKTNPFRRLSVLFVKHRWVSHLVSIKGVYI